MASRFQATQRDANDFPTTQLFVLAIVRLAEPIALTSIFPYSWELVKRFGVGNEKHASFYSGLLISAFSLAEALTGIFWGSLSDRVGRKPILLCGCAGTVLSLLIIGFAQNFWVALAGRTIGGILNGNIGIIQTVVGELVTRPEHEPRAYSVMPFVWSMGTIIGPAIGGTFVDPSISFPCIFSPQGIFAKFPYLLSNLICASILIISIITGYIFLEETHPKIRPRYLPSPSYIPEGLPINNATLDLQKESLVKETHLKTYGTCDAQDSCVLIKNTNGKNANAHVFTKRIIRLVIATGIFSYHSMTYDQLLPIFFEDKPVSLSTVVAITDHTNFRSSGGLGLSVQQVGFIMSVDGFLALVVQAGVFPFVAAYFGIQRIFLIASLFHPLTFLMMPFLVYLPVQWLSVGIYFCLTIRNFLTIIAFSALLISLKEATPSVAMLGRVNGLDHGFGSLVWYTSAFIAGIGAIQAFTIRSSGAQNEKEDWKDEEAPTCVNSSVNSSDDERDGESIHGRGFDSDSDKNLKILLGCNKNL